MSVFTPVSFAQLADWLKAYELGALQHLEGIREGVQNSNFFVDTVGERHVLTLFEAVAPALIPFYLDLMAHLAARGIPCPAPRRRRDGRLLGMLNGRPAALFSRLSGQSLLQPTPAHCAAVGRALARLHRAGEGMAAPPHPRGADWIARTAARVLPLLARDDAALLDEELAFQQTPSPALPSGVIHADLFRDNVLFDGAEIGGLLDFYFAGQGEFLFDLAIAANDWCIDEAGRLDVLRVTALQEAYRAVRPLTADECLAWPRQLRAAALRFWLSRLEDFHCPQQGEAVTVRDPAAFARILRLRATQPPAPLPAPPLA